MNGTVIGGMEHRRLQRIALSSLFAAVIALGGYFLGYAKTQEQPAEIDLKNPAFLQNKFPKDFPIYVIKHNAQKIGIKPSELTKLMEKTKPLVAEYLQARKKLWADEVEYSRLAEEGKVLNSLGRFDAMSYEELRADAKMRGPFENARIRTEVEVANILGKDRQHVLNKIRNVSRLDEVAASLEVLLNSENFEKLGLSQAQQNQMILIEAYFAQTIRNPKKPSTTTYRLEEVLPHRDENHRLVLSSKDYMKGYFYYHALDRLSPLQKLRLKALVCDKLYVEL